MNSLYTSQDLHVNVNIILQQLLHKLFTIV